MTTCEFYGCHYEASGETFNTCITCGGKRYEDSQDPAAAEEAEGASDNGRND